MLLTKRLSLYHKITSGYGTRVSRGFQGGGGVTGRCSDLLLVSEDRTKDSRNFVLVGSRCRFSTSSNNSNTKGIYTSPLYARTYSSFFSTSSSSMVNRLGLSSHKWSQMEPARYEDVVRTAVKNGINTIEVGQEGKAGTTAEEILLKAIKASDTDNPGALTVLFRLGYRTISTPFEGGGASESSETENDKTSLTKDDVLVEELQEKDAMSTVVHNLSPEYLDSVLKSSLVVEEYRKKGTGMSIIGMIHNPEVQIMQHIKNHEMDDKQRQDFIYERLLRSFQFMENAVQEGYLSSYGVVSNGLCLPSDHPLHLSWENAVLRAVKDTNSSNNKNHFSAVQLPINLLETAGLEVAKQIQQQNSIDNNQSPIDVIAMRPLTCYPDRGTGTGFPFQLVDYLLPTRDVLDATAAASAYSNEQHLSWTNEMESVPLVYQNALKEAMSHFDAEEILQALYEEDEKEKQGDMGGDDSRKQLTMEQRETLDGCKLLQSMLFDLDQGLEKMRSYQVHEDQLYTKIIPLIYDTFEEYDEQTATVLQNFFTAYSLAVKYYVAKNTRALLSQGGEAEVQQEALASASTSADEGSAAASRLHPLLQVVKPYDIPQHTKLQEFAIKFLLKDKAISKIMVGCSQPHQVIQNVKTALETEAEPETKTEE